MERREAHPEDTVYIISTILDQDKVLDIIEQLSLYNAKPIIYQVSLIPAQSLLLLYNNSNEKDQFITRQNKILMYTTIFLWNIRLLLSSSSGRQQKLSASVAALMVSGDNECCSLIARMFPDSLLKKISSKKPYPEWRPENWKELFGFTQNNYCTATDQWNNECRIELNEKLKKTVLDYLAIKYSKRDNKEEKIRWNHEEYEVQYSCLEQKCKVGKYYLKDLLNQTQGVTPYLTETVMNPVKFWIVLFFI